LRATHFHVDLAGLGLANPRLLQGTLDAQLQVRGTRAQPTVQGELRFADGRLAIAGDPRIYQDIQIALGVANGELTPRRLTARIARGRGRASGSAPPGGLRPQSIDLRASAHQLPVPAGNVTGRLDSEVTLHGAAIERGWGGELTVERGTLTLPTLSARRRLQP